MIGARLPLPVVHVGGDRSGQTFGRSGGSAGELASRSNDQAPVLQTVNSTAAGARDRVAAPSPESDETLCRAQGEPAMSYPATTCAVGPNSRIASPFHRETLRVAKARHISRRTNRQSQYDERSIRDPPPSSSRSDRPRQTDRRSNRGTTIHAHTYTLLLWVRGFSRRLHREHAPR